MVLGVLMWEFGVILLPPHQVPARSVSPCGPTSPGAGRFSAVGPGAGVWCHCVTPPCRVLASLASPCDPTLLGASRFGAVGHGLGSVSPRSHFSLSARGFGVTAQSSAGCHWVWDPGGFLSPLAGCWRVQCRGPQGGCRCPVAEWPEDSLSGGVVMSGLSQHSREASEARAGGKGDTVAVGTEPIGAGDPCQRGWHVPSLRLRAQGDPAATLPGTLPSMGQGLAVHGAGCRGCRGYRDLQVRWAPGTSCLLHQSCYCGTETRLEDTVSTATITTATVTAAAGPQAWHSVHPQSPVGDSWAPGTPQPFTGVVEWRPHQGPSHCPWRWPVVTVVTVQWPCHSPSQCPWE